MDDELNRPDIAFNNAVTACSMAEVKLESLRVSGTETEYSTAFRAMVKARELAEKARLTLARHRASKQVS
jgi:hypothetical protein